tara:strand:- start:249 stop:683 length:435 start_codon:yes stop_codon:yes gene_type:complete
MTKQDPIEYSSQDGRFHEENLIGQRLKKLRLENGLTQKDLSERLNITYQQIQNYENGKSRLSLENAKKLADFLGVPLEAFSNNVFKSDRPSTGLSDNEQTIVMMDEPIDKTKADLLKAYHSIKDPEKQKNLVKLVKEMARNMQD